MTEIARPYPPAYDGVAFRPFVGPGEDLWIFGYGSLIWRPDFPFEERHRARLHGFHRRFCIYSYRYRGTPERPGLVLGLDRGGSCVGMAFRVAAAQAEAVSHALWAREMVTAAYRPATVRVAIAGRTVGAGTFIADSRHRQYCADRDLDGQARMIAFGHGTSGANADYLANTLVHLRELGIRDERLEALERRVRVLGAGA